ncbi:DUF1622 domain-containing protein [Erysipelothrix sp. HDW6B]|uniref:DUF1622 domain-containing protein n=1 Tax=Erysipelothrix TaxID=1647 RepID=UPI00135840FB|nr:MULTISPECIES: DUF1622 domain-containing protein [Erysipelothrix]QIK86259.1 DUF1622 domain-containing protein [Erysipelothrix sp. HDW6B]
MTVETVVHILIVILNTISVLILVLGVIKAIIRFINVEFSLKNNVDRDEVELRSINIIKRNLGAYVLLSLEVLIAADIIESILNPTIEDILMLGAVVIIRTVISFFLGKEIEAVES